MLTVKDRIQQAVSSGGSGTVTLGSAIAGYQALGGNEDGLIIPGYFTDTGNTWEVGEYTYTDATKHLARTRILASSSGGSALTLTTSAVFNCEIPAAVHGDFIAAAQAMLPGGRLTATSGSPVTISDVTSATHLYYTPHFHNVINLWDGQRWAPTIFAEYDLTLSATSGNCYDVFAYLSSGALALETLAWTSTTARATAVTIQDGRYCKSGDKTRLYLGSFYASGANTTKDAVVNRLLWNMYNRAPRQVVFTAAGAPNTYSTNSAREWGGVTNRVNIMRGLNEEAVMVINTSRMGATVAETIGTWVDIDSLSASFLGLQIQAQAAGSDVELSNGAAVYIGLGLHQLIAAQQNFTGSPTGNFTGFNIFAEVMH